MTIKDLKSIVDFWAVDGYEDYEIYINGDNTILPQIVKSTQVKLDYSKKHFLVKTDDPTN